MPAGDNPHSISEKKAALRESPKQSKSAVIQQDITSSFPKDKAAESVGIKRPQFNGALTPANHHMPGNPGTNGHLVYVRRRHETDQSKGGTSVSAETFTSLSSKKPVLGGLQEESLNHQNSVPRTQPAPVSASPAAAATVPALPSGNLPGHFSFGKQSQEKVTVHPSIVVTASPPHRNVVSAAMPRNVTATNIAPTNVAATSTASREAVATTAARNPPDLQRSTNEDRKERFIRLQAFLRNNEQSGQDEYIRILRSLSSVDRRKHAIELEKRAVNLLIEEGKELQKMKALNVLGKLPSTEHLSLPTQPTFAMRLPFEPFPARR
ncbi:uncharacterized protein LOC100825460 [Brachypodium distachyon]|uniref:Uncharacterized protein n=1 Tax=Brachypodium distachyon TaxID=15368 RepID=I1ISJ5_BRADI|nr:uncharacterized protein LOC100825460 [Brachypodium distachyon]XP_010238465.1 uncharacterized protein LOC100825460 [Brachypodium distachyon]XP_010238466.1 uncharacterized protein LOC100825460 [Brachypodium distachyon]XP_010238467.1 uncharacterized protein LOC100825460 [Brachypodium distachyon]XP_014758421.1 uncharacterized protein LOC100825460 [Brachypodium distachyon]XP_024310848.1 uncharacterized protein LOC100825460 [Brachypodium distachyon]XP_024310849.1 uncharacterized protein LOC10082|eukprot:XP_003578584.1 uncharacterized protein LOC100825460 [Brachypodium distachyon]